MLKGKIKPEDRQYGARMVAPWSPSIPSPSLSALPFSTRGFCSVVQGSSGAIAIIGTFRHQEGKRNGEGETDFFL